VKDTTNPTRVLFITGTLGLGGAEMLVTNWCECLHRNGFECVVLCILRKAGPHLATLEGLGIRVIELIQTECNAFAFFKRLRTVVKAIEPDVVHSQCAWSIPQQAYAAKMGGAKGFVITVHNTYSPGNIIQRIRRKAAMLIARPFVDNIIGVSEAVSDYTRGWLGLPKERVSTILNGIVCERFDLPEVEKAIVRKELGLPEKAVLAVTVGALSLQKDHLTLIRAAVTLRERMPDLRFVIVGGGRQRKVLDKHLRDNDAEDTVIFMGRRTDVPRILQACDLFVLTSRWEGLGLVFAEAHAAGLPVVGSNVGGIPEVVLDGRTGLLVPPGNVERLSSAIEYLVSHYDEAREMGQRGREHVFKHFNIKRCSSQYAQVYRSLAVEKTI